MSPIKHRYSSRCRDALAIATTVALATSAYAADKNSHTVNEGPQTKLQTHTAIDDGSTGSRLPFDNWIDLLPPKSPLPLLSHGVNEDGSGKRNPPLFPPPPLDPFLDGLIKFTGGDLFDEPFLILPPDGGSFDLPMDIEPPRLDLLHGNDDTINYAPPAGSVPGPGAIPLLAAAALLQRYRRRRRALQ